MKWLQEIWIKSMIHECEIENEPAELLVGRTRPVDGEAGADSIKFKICDYGFNDSDKYIYYRLQIAFDEEVAHVKQVFSEGNGKIMTGLIIKGQKTRYCKLKLCILMAL